MSQQMKSLEDYLDNLDYASLNTYSPSVFSLGVMNFIKMVNGAQGEANKTPPFHLKMLDGLVSGSKRLINICSRGSAKTTLMGEYLILYLACFNYIPNFGKVNGMIYVSDSMENGAKSLRKNIQYRYENSEFLQDLLPPKLQTFTDNYLEFTNTKGEKLGVRLFGATTGVRGVKLFGKRPCIAILDDLISDSSSKSQADMNMIKEIVYKGINYALDPNHYKIILNGTPFNRQDILLEAIASGV